MTADIQAKRTTTEDLAKVYPNHAADLEARGWVAMIQVVSKRTAAMLYEAKGGSLHFAAGSRSLADRYTREGAAS